MKMRAKLILTFLFGLAVGAAIGRHWLTHPAPVATADAVDLGAVPKEREGLLVFKHVLEHHPNARSLKFLAWWPPEQVSENPWTHEPAARVRVVLQNQARDPRAEKLESLVFYVQGDRVLGNLSNPDENTSIRYARVQPAQEWGTVGTLN